MNTETAIAKLAYISGKLYGLAVAVEFFTTMSKEIAVKQMLEKFAEIDAEREKVESEVKFHL